MCDAIVMGVATFAMGAMQSIAGYQSQSAAAAASEQAYQQQRTAYEAQLSQNQLAANKAYQQTQLKLKGEYDQASQTAEKLLTQRLQAQGAVMASGRMGQSIGGLLRDAQRTEGKDLANLGLNLAYAQQDYGFGMESIFDQQVGANAQATSQINQAAANRLAQPSIGGLLLGIGEAGIAGGSTYMSLKAPKGFDQNPPPPTPPPTPPPSDKKSGK
jgi:hypothetical protein